MRFSENGFYVESYVKCANCGLLIYDDGLPGQRHDQAVVFCSPWCVEWAGLRDSRDDHFRLPLQAQQAPRGKRRTASRACVNSTLWSPAR